MPSNHRGTRPPLRVVPSRLTITAVSSPALEIQMRLSALSPHTCRTPPTFIAVTLPAGIGSVFEHFGREDDTRAAPSRAGGDELTTSLHNLGMLRGVNSAIVTHGP